MRTAYSGRRRRTTLSCGLACSDHRSQQRTPRLPMPGSMPQGTRVIAQCGGTIVRTPQGHVAAAGVRVGPGAVGSSLAAGSLEGARPCKADSASARCQASSARKPLSSASTTASERCAAALVPAFMIAVRRRVIARVSSAPMRSRRSALPASRRAPLVLRTGCRSFAKLAFAPRDQVDGLDVPMRQRSRNSGVNVRRQKLRRQSLMRDETV